MTGRSVLQAKVISNELRSMSEFGGKVNRKSLSIRHVILILGLMFFIAVTHSVAQGTASISGTVVDASQAIVPGSQVTLTNVGTAQVRTILSSEQGLFEFPGVPPGLYKVTVSKSGFKTWEQSSITLAVSQSLTLYPQMEIGSATEQVVVTSEASVLTTESSSLSGVVNSAQIQELPLNGRNALQLEALEPGVVSTGTSGQFGATQVTFSSSGGRDIDTNYTLDGGINVNPFYAIPNYYPNPDALQEFAVSSRNYSARFGRGTTDVSAVTRSGTNAFHGSAFEFVRTTNLDATPYFSKEPPGFHRNQFGGAVGGPIFKNRLFFFGSYQGTHQSGSPGPQTYTTVPLPERTGDFSALSTPVIDPLTGLPFPGNIIPADRITSQATNFFNTYLPAPNQGTNTYTFPNVGTLTENQLVTKIDYQASQKDVLFGRYFFENLPQVGYGSGSGSALDTTWLSKLPFRYQSITLGSVHTFSPRLINDFHITYERTSFGEFTNLPFSLSAIGYDINTESAYSSYGLNPDSSLSVGGSFSAYPGAPTRDIAPTYDISDNVSWIKGKHSINAGIQIYKNRINELQNFWTGGAMNFNGQFSGVGAADFLLGKFSSYTQISGLNARLHQTLPSAYVQDDVKVMKRLTMNLGVRWDIVGGYTSENDQLSTFRPGQQSTVYPLATRGLLYPGDKGVPKDIIGTRLNNFAPRVGLAWDVFGQGKTSLRAGFGIYYVPMTEGISLNRLTLIQPFTLNVTVSGGDAQNIFAGAPFNGVNPFPRPTSPEGLKTVPFVPTASATSLPTTWKTQSTNAWSLSIQQQLWKSAVLETNYVGSSASHMFTSAQGNPGVYIPGNSSPSNLQSRRLYPEIGPIELDANLLSSNYNALQVVYNQKLRSLAVKSAFTWSKNLGVNSGEGAGSSGPRDPFNWHRDYSPLTGSVPLVWVTSVIWKPLSGNNLNPLLRYTIGGWEVGGISTLQDGSPLNLTSGRDNSQNGVGADTPDIVGDYHIRNQSKADQIAHWFNPAAFTQNAIGTFGELRPNTLMSPGYINFDINLQKNFKFADRYGIEFRGSFYNAFNHANLNAPVSTLTSANFGAIVSTSAPRVIELGTRVTF